MGYRSWMFGHSLFPVTHYPFFVLIVKVNQSEIETSHYQASQFYQGKIQVEERYVPKW
jgi:hypothetical protein